MVTQPGLDLASLKEIRARLDQFSPRTDLGLVVRDCFRYLPEDLAAELLDRVQRTIFVESSLSLVHIRPGPSGFRHDYGVVSRKVITDAGVAFLVDAFQNTTELENLKYHGIGTGGTAESAAQTALVTEITTEYSVNSTRPTGSTTEGASANIYRTVGTITVDAAVAATEHGIFSQAATGGGTMWDRSLFSVINLANGDSLQATYDATFTSGG
jgi:hypothetical protein